MGPDIDGDLESGLPKPQVHCHERLCRWIRITLVVLLVIAWFAGAVLLLVVSEQKALPAVIIVLSLIGVEHWAFETIYRRKIKRGRRQRELRKLRQQERET